MCCTKPNFSYTVSSLVELGQNTAESRFYIGWGVVSQGSSWGRTWVTHQVWWQAPLPDESPLQHKCLSCCGSSPVTSASVTSGHTGLSTLSPCRPTSLLPEVSNSPRPVSACPPPPELQEVLTGGAASLGAFPGPRQHFSPYNYMVESQGVPVVPAPGSRRQEDREFKVNLDHMKVSLV